jgi:hypothetical protein
MTSTAGQKLIFCVARDLLATVSSFVFTLRQLPPRYMRAASLAAANVQL